MTQNIKQIFTGAIKSLTPFELSLWIFSLGAVSVCYAFIPDKNIFTLFSSLSGVSLVLFVGKGTVLGQIFTIFFSLCYGVVSFKLRFYSEMITYLGMNTPIAIATMITWLRNPYKDSVEVTVAHMNLKKWLMMILSTIVVTVIFYFILKALGTANLIICTVSIATSFGASYLEYLRSSYYAVGFMANDTVLIVLWLTAALKEKAYAAMAVCFVIFFINDLYGFINWQRMKKRQKN